jgi:hypothetical protein
MSCTVGAVMVTWTGVLNVPGGIVSVAKHTPTLTEICRPAGPTVTLVTTAV